MIMMMIKYLGAGVIGLVIGYFLGKKSYGFSEILQALSIIDNVVEVAVKTVEQYSKTIKEVERVDEKGNKVKVPLKGRTKMEEALRIVGYALGQKGLSSLKKVIDNVEGYIVAKIEEKVFHLGKEKKGRK